MDSLLRLELLKNKTENARSAVASQEVREHLAGFIRSKRQGSSSHLDNIQEQNKLQAVGQAGDRYYGSCGTDSQSDDHPLRKTASMPTMHIPYKAQSLSRRRQLERRTTMSPLTRRKSRPAKPKHPAHSKIDRMNSNSTEYSSNPCILEASRANARSLSQSSTPPPSDQSDFTCAGQLAAAAGGTGELSCRSDSTTTSSSVGASAHRKMGDITGSKLANVSESAPSTSFAGADALSLKQQQHLKVNEAIRETLIRRTTDKQMLAASAAAGAGGSLDINPQSTNQLIQLAPEERFGAASRAHPIPGCSAHGEFRQWSLDEPKEKALEAQGKSMGSGMFQRASFSGNKRRPNLAGDLSSRLNYRTPNPSMSIGGAGASGAPSLLAGAHHRAPPSVLSGAHNKHLYSSSSSSTSSLLSQQDSLDDNSSSQAIDLSSSSERQRSAAAAAAAGTGSLAAHNRRAAHPLQHQQQLMQSSQKVLQESFRQLQLCHPDPAPGLLLNPVHQHPRHIVSPLPATNHLPSTMLNPSAAPTHSQQYTQTQQHTSPAGLINATQCVSSSKSLIPGGAPLASLHHSPAASQTPAELNNLLIAYQNLVEYQQQQQHQQQPSSQVTAVDASSAQTAYKSPGIFSHLLLHQQPQQPSSVLGPSPELYQRPAADRQRPSAIWRTLSSPLLATGIPHDKASIAAYESMKLAHLSSLDEKRSSVVCMQVDEDSSPALLAERKRSPEVESLDLSLGGGAQEKVCAQTQVFPASGGTTMSRPTSGAFDGPPVFDQRSSTGLTYELDMCSHRCICANEANHPENSYRVLAIWARLQERGLLAKCARIEGRKATFEELRLCHSDIYTQYFGKTPGERARLTHLDLSKLPIKGLLQLECGGQGADIDTAWNEELTPRAARLAAGCVIEAALSVATGRLENAFAVVRPPGHHAEFQQAMGFCYFNSVAVAASLLVAKQLVGRVLIVDWDVHHGNGIQRLFYEDNRVLYLSLHRHDRGNFFPGTGDPSELGAGPGLGYNLNVAWSNEIMGDAEYLAAFRSLVMPVARAFEPNLVLVACGFDAARGHALNFGGYHLSAQCFAFMTRQLMKLAGGRLVLCLEGGYQLSAMCDCAESCLRALLKEPRAGSLEALNELELRREPNQSACETLYELSNYAAKHWPGVERWRSTIDQSALEAAGGCSSSR